MNMIISARKNRTGLKDDANLINNIYALRMIRQGFNERLDREQYESIFRLMSPVMTAYWTMPGNPPVIQHRADFSDFHYNDKMRSRRTIVKGRFQNGGVAYVFFDEIELYIALYIKKIDRISPKMAEIISLIEHEGPINVQGMKDVLGMYVKDITPYLHKLQTAFIVFEDQKSVEGDRGYYFFESEFPEVNLNRYEKIEAIKIILMRFQSLMVWFQIEMAESFYKLSKKEIQRAIDELVNEHQLRKLMIDNQEGYISPTDLDQINTQQVADTTSQFFSLNKNDFYAKAMESRLKSIFPKNKYEPMYYLLYQGQFIGAVYGKFRIRPDELEDVIIRPEYHYLVSRKADIIKAISKTCDFERSPLKRFMGEQL